MPRYEFVDASIHEIDIHPDSIFRKEQELARNFVTGVIVEDQTVKCPICESENTKVFFEKWGQKYNLCKEEWSLNLLPLPDEELLTEYFFTSELARFRASRDYQNVVSQMRKGLWESLIEWIEGRVRRYIGMNKYNVIDWGSKFVGWVDTLEKASFVEAFSIQQSLPPINSSESLKQADLVCLFDVIQRTVNPHKLLKDIYSKLLPNGLLLITCRSGSGFDVITLREQSDTIFPFDHINLPSPKGMQKLLESNGFEVLELTTPGLLDIEIIKNSINKIPEDQYFQKYLVSEFDEIMLERMQSFLQQNNLSSHLRVVARKVEDYK